MQRLASFTLFLVIGLSLLVASERPALAYVDPGSGFVALQTFASVVAAGGYFLRRRIRALFGGKTAESAGASLKEAQAETKVVPADRARLEVKGTRRPA